jgi:N-methylhydantoinase A
MRVGIEVGGTFTDLILVEQGKIRVAKVPSTPESPDIGAINAIEAAGINLTTVDDFVHGSTVATNAVLERKGGRVCALVTKGMRDLFALQRHDRRAIYDLHYRKPVPIVERRHVLEIDERLSAGGGVVKALDPIAAKAALAQFLSEHEFDAVAICLLHSYANPAHERALADIVRECAPGMSVTCSCDVSREFREYERASTTALAGYVQPVIEGYINRLVATLERHSFSGRFSIMQSNGGRMPSHAMAKNAIAALFSGPAAGVVGAIGVAGRSGYNDIITLDMGGTSTDVSLVSGGEPELAAQTEIDGLPVRTPVIDIVTVGAGGGSIAWVDDGGLLRVGPQSAGATPGPASYGRGGDLPTVTDAHLIRGTLQAQSFLGGKMAVDVDAARRVHEGLSAQLGLSVEALADSVIRIAEANIVRAIQQVSTERGRDPRDYVLVPYGGAGPLHAARVAEDLGIPVVVVPPNAGVLSAAGLLMSDYVHYRSRTERTPVQGSAMADIGRILRELKTEAEEYLRSVGVGEPLEFEQILEMRYVGQAFEVSVVLEAGEEPTTDGLTAAFAEAHHRIFEFSKPPEDPAEIVSFRIGARARTEDFPADVAAIDETVNSAVRAVIQIVEGGAHMDCTVMPRQAVTAKPDIGPILVQDETSTIFVPPGWSVRLDGFQSLILKRGA